MLKAIDPEMQTKSAAVEDLSSMNKKDDVTSSKSETEKLVEQRLQRLMAEVTGYAIVLMDKNGIISTWNRGAERIKGYTADEIIGRSFKLFYSKEDKEDGLPDRMLETASREGTANHEGWRVRKNGSRFWGSVTITAIHDDDNQVNSFLKVTWDMTNRKIAEDNFNNYVEHLKQTIEDLKRSEDRYHKMVTEVHDYAIILLSRDGKVLDWNKGAEIIKGYTTSEILGKNFRLFYPKEEKEKGLPERLLNGAVQKGSITHEGWRVRKDGTRFWGSVAITALHDQKGEIFGFSKVTRDLTERKMAEDKLNNFADELKQRNDELKRSEERYHKMVAEIQDYAIILLDSEGIIQNWNAGAEHIKGYTSQEIIGKSFKLFYPEGDRQAKLPDSLLEKARVNGKVEHEGWRLRKDGTLFWGHVVITALHDPFNKVIGFSKVTRDLTQRKLADDRLKANALELERKNKILERLNDEISSFAYVASHDLKEPLRKIQTFANHLIDSDPWPTNGKEFVEKISRTAAQMQRLMEDLLAYSTIANDFTAATPIDLNDIVRTVINDLEVRIREKNGAIRSDKLPTIKGVGFQFHQLFLNLLSNALKFSKPDEPSVIEITHQLVRGSEIADPDALAEQQYHKISIRDNGIGFESEHAKKIFDVFHRLHPRNTFGGTGIGLAIVKKITESHNGIIIAEGEPDVGATFHVFLPTEG
jgi:PAS domain S-box-containing protein